MTEQNSVQQERDAISGRWLTVLVLGTLSIAAIGVAVSWLLLRRAGPAPRDAQASRSALAESQRLEHHAFEREGRGLRFEAEQRQQLTRYSWVDRDAGLARIPIERAMELVVERERP